MSNTQRRKQVRLKEYDYTQEGAYFVTVCTKEHDCRGASRGAPTTNIVNVKRKPLGQLIGAFKTVSTKQINQLRHTPREPVWQRGFYEHIVRDENDLNRIRDYMMNNPGQWEDDEYYQ